MVDEVTRRDFLLATFLAAFAAGTFTELQSGGVRSVVPVGNVSQTGSSFKGVVSVAGTDIEFQVVDTRTDLEAPSVDVALAYIRDEGRFVDWQ